MQNVHRTGKGDSGWRDSSAFGGLKDKFSNDEMTDQQPPDLLTDHLRTLTAQDFVVPEGYLAFRERDFFFPSNVAEIGHFRRRVFLRVQKACDEHMHFLVTGTIRIPGGVTNHTYGLSFASRAAIIPADVDGRKVRTV